MSAATLYTSVSLAITETRLNTSGTEPFAVVSFGDADIHVNTEAAGRQIAAAFTRAADLLAAVADQVQP